MPRNYLLGQRTLLSLIGRLTVVRRSVKIVEEGCLWQQRLLIFFFNLPKDICQWRYVDKFVRRHLTSLFRMKSRTFKTLQLRKFFWIEDVLLPKNWDCRRTITSEENNSLLVWTSPNRHNIYCTLTSILKLNSKQFCWWNTWQTLTGILCKMLIL